MSASNARRASHNVRTHVLNGTAPHAASIDGLILSSSVNGRDVLNGEDVIELRPQVAAAFAKMAEVLAEAGATPDDVGLMTVNMANYGEVRQAVLDEWDRMFPNGQGPVMHMLVPQGGFPKPNTFLGIQFVARKGAKRQSLVIDGQAREGNLPHVVTLGDFVVVGKIVPAEGLTDDAQAKSIFEQLDARLAAANVKKSEVGYLRTYCQTREGRGLVQRAFSDYFGSARDAALPALLPLVLPEMPRSGAMEMSHAFAVRNGTAEGFLFDQSLIDTDCRVGSDIAVRGPFFFSAGISGLRMAGGKRETEPNAQAENMYQAARQALEGISCTFDNLCKVNMWLSGKSSKDLALIGWKKIFGTSDQGARDKTPARTFLIHAQPALDPDVFVEFELIGVR